MEEGSGVGEDVDDATSLAVGVMQVGEGAMVRFV